MTPNCAPLSFFPMDEAWSEVIIAPFHDPLIAADLPITAEARGASGFYKQQDWCWLSVGWSSAPPQTIAGVITLPCGELALESYDMLLVCLTMPEGCRLRVTAEDEM